MASEARSEPYLSDDLAMRLWLAAHECELRGSVAFLDFVSVIAETLPASSDPRRVVEVASQVLLELRERIREEDPEYVVEHEREMRRLLSSALYGLRVLERSSRARTQRVSCGYVTRVRRPRLLRCRSGSRGDPPHVLRIRSRCDPRTRPLAEFVRLRTKVLRFHSRRAS